MKKSKKALLLAFIVIVVMVIFGNIINNTFIVPILGIVACLLIIYSATIYGKDLFI